jgi:hypothetical protein
MTALATAWSGGCSDTTGPFQDQTPDPDRNDPVRIDFEWRGPIAKGNQIEIKGVFGDIRASWTSGREVVVTATKIGGAHEVAGVDIEAVTHADGVTICAVYPDVPGQRPNECAAGDYGNMSVRDSTGGAVEVEFTVHVPAGVVFVARTLAGDVEATELESDAFLRTLWGDAHVSTTGIATAKTMSGAITASIGEANWGRDLEFLTMSGDIALEIPSNTNAEIEAKVLSGKVASEFPLTRAPTGDMRGVIGTGGDRLTLATLHGDITLRRGP